MSFEGRSMGMPAPAPQGKKEVAHKVISFTEREPHSPGEEFENAQAEKILEGLTTPEELAVKFGPYVMDIVMKKVQAISEYKTFGLGDPYKQPVAGVPPQTIYPKIPHPLFGIIPRVLEHYKNENKTEEDEQEFLDLLSDLKRDKKFRDILSQYDPLIALYPDRTEEFEIKAMNDFIELNARIAKPE